MARQVGLVKGEWVAIDGSKFRAVSSAQAVREREAVKRYLDQLENADQPDEVTIDERAMAAALEKLKNDPEPEARFMRMANGPAPPTTCRPPSMPNTRSLLRSRSRPRPMTSVVCCRWRKLRNTRLAIQKH